MIDRCHNGLYLKRAVFRSDDHPGRDRDGRFVQRVFRGVGMPVGKKILMPMFQTVKEARPVGGRVNGDTAWAGVRRFNGKANAMVTDTRMNMHSYEERPRFESELQVGDWECSLEYYLPPGDRPRQPAPSGVEQKILWALHLIINGDPLQELSPQVVRRLNRLVQNRHHPIWRYVVNLQLERNRRVSRIEDSMRYLLDGIHRAAGVPAEMLHEAADLMREPEWEYSEYDERSDADE